MSKAEAEAETGSQTLPKPVINNGRFEMPWAFAQPNFGKVLQFIFCADDKSNIPRLSEVNVLLY